MKFLTETLAFNYFKLRHGIQTFNITYGPTAAKAQVWIEEKHSVDNNVKTAIIQVHANGDWKYVTSVSTYMIGVGVDNEKVMTDLYVEGLSWGTGTTNITLTLM